MEGDRLVDRYRLLARHATGGMATVWRATDEWTGETVAIKRLHPYVIGDPAARSRLDREADALRAVDHPAIVRPREVIDDPDAPALVMDFVDGRSLDERIADGPLPPGEALAIAAMVADALAVAHRQGIVHRDIKPSNIVVDDLGAVHLVDFGIVALEDAPPNDLTAPSMLVGTPRYSAPERLGGEAGSPRSDVWALGTVLYEMLSGRPAIEVDDPVGAMAAGRLGPDLSRLPAPAAGVIERAMAPEPDDRYPDAAAFRDALLAADGPARPDAPTVAIANPAAEPAPMAAVASARRPTVRPLRGRPVAAGVIAVAAALAVAVASALSGFSGAGDGSDARTTGSPRTSVSPSVTSQPAREAVDASGGGGRARDPKPVKEPPGHDKGHGQEHGHGREKDD